MKRNTPADFAGGIDYNFNGKLGLFNGKLGLKVKQALRRSALSTGDKRGFHSLRRKRRLWEKDFHWYKKKQNAAGKVLMK